MKITGETKVFRARERTAISPVTGLAIGVIAHKRIEKSILKKLGFTHMKKHS
jgi:hypothetical protein